MWPHLTAKLQKKTDLLDDNNNDRDEVEVEAPPTDLLVILSEESLSLEEERCASGRVLKQD